jgi:uncharacterized phage protein (TIGR01671 family)
MRDYRDRFRYRVWHKEFNRFLTGEEWYLDMDGRLRFAEYPQGNGDNSANSVFTPVGNPDKFVIQTCTGAEDKNKKLIYEGDIVRVKRCHTVSREVSKNCHTVDLIEDGEEVGFVCWLPFQYGYSIAFRSYDDIAEFDGIDHRIEVIGNTCENAELIRDNRNYGEL